MRNILYLLLASAGAMLVAGCDRGDIGADGVAPKPSHGPYSLRWGSHEVPSTVPRGVPFTVKVSVVNTGDWTWNDPFAANPSKPDGTYAIRLAYRWVSASGTALPHSQRRGELSAPVPPKETANFTMQVDPPAEAGSYQLQFELIEELVNFFSAGGAERLGVPVSVQ